MDHSLVQFRFERCQMYINDAQGNGAALEMSLWRA